MKSLIQDKNDNNNQKKSYLLVMTACIDPGKNSKLVVRNDPYLRLQDYKHALQFWLNYPDERLTSILFVENSGYSLVELKSVYSSSSSNKKVEFISIEANELPPGLHYGYAELAMIDEALEKSDLFQANQYIIKVTGRLLFPSLTRLLNHLPEDYLFAVDCREPTFLTRNRPPFVTTQLMLFSSDFYRKNLLNIKDIMNSDMSYIEPLLYRELTKYYLHNDAILRWSINCPAVGIGAHSGKNYQSVAQRLVQFGRSFARKFFPEWYI